ncbi:fumarylacetoacetate hydrolase family protein [Phenylobacterium sp.]|jgi:fumarylpyruvate hydrolase|uniref:fumarylacetoacetate hydrolase family protein n=1 Tax=Phenylobacterium sp. TaxID=1871053 RepID=UPI002E342793|nr:fumarylacetoacetate hydrolase family protein [Phenylobacterium sp.]HEX2558882.1 fumarylacetoacetate hydrolase family protein [Phenylobacterium sp.]
MASMIFDLPVPAVPVEGEAGLFPVRRIYCVGRNYQAHRVEMGGAADDRSPPFFFSKPADAVVPPGAPVPYPTQTSDLHHEVELVAAIGQAGQDVPVARALELVFGYAVGVDLTRRDLQAGAKKRGEPWEAAKGFDASAPISALRRWSGPAPQGRIRLSVNGQTRQDATVSDMIWNVAEIVSEASKLWRLAPGDLIFTGTPEGVGALVRGDKVECEVDGVARLTFEIG